MSSGRGILIVLIIALALVILHVVRKKLKTINVGAVTVISGAVKSGKSGLSVYLAIKQYRKNVFRWRFRKVIAILFHKEIPLKPMLYSNIPLRWVKFNKFSKNILLRKVRIPEQSVVLIDEASLLADSMLFKDKTINARLMLFVKLFGHYTHGGNLIINTQSISDLHFSFKRCVSNYIYILDNVRYPFFTAFHVREMLYCDDQSSINVIGDDLELSMRKALIRNKYFKSYDKYCLSAFTDNLAYEVDYDAEILGRFDSLKVTELVTLQDFRGLLTIDGEDS